MKKLQLALMCLVIGTTISAQWVDSGNTLHSDGHYVQIRIDGTPTLSLYDLNAGQNRIEGSIGIISSSNDMRIDARYGNLLFRNGLSGTATTRMMLDTDGDLTISGSQPDLFFNKSASGTAGLIWGEEGGTEYGKITMSNGIVYQGLQLRANNNSNNLQAMHIKPNGNVGIGDDTASYKLSINGTTNLLSKGSGNIAARVKGDEAIWYDGDHFSWGYGGNWNFMAEALKLGAPGSDAPPVGSALYINNSEDIVMDGSGSKKINFVDGGSILGSIGYSSLGHLDIVNSQGGGDVVVRSYYRDVIMTTTGGPGIVLKASGKVGINTNAPTHDLHIAGDVAVAGQIVHPSDKNLKENIANITNGLSTINQLSPKSYTHKTDKATKFGLSTKPQFGLIAQDVEKVLPEIVVQKALIGEDGEIFKGLDYEKLIPILVSAVQELSTKNTNLTELNNNLINRVEVLENSTSSSK